MIVNEADAIKRLNSPMNLMNRLRQTDNKDSKKNNAMQLFGVGRAAPKVEVKTFNPFETAIPEASHTTSQAPVKVSNPMEQTKLDNILDNHESQIKLGLAHDRALDLLNRSVEALSAKLDEVSAAKLPSVISAASKTVESIRRERLESSKLGKDQEVHFHFYTPEQHKVSDYEIIDVQ